MTAPALRATWARRLLSLLAVAVAACGTAGCAAADRTSDLDGALPAAAEYYASEYGVRVGIEVGFGEDRRLTDVRLVWDGGSDHVSPYPIDGTDPDAPLETLDLAAGTRALLEGTVVTACPDVPSLLVFEVESRVGGGHRVDRYVPNDPDQFEQAVADWCGLGITMRPTGSQVTPEGDYQVWIEFTNPGPQTATVVSEAFSLDGAQWERSELELQPGSIGVLTVDGHGPPGCAATPPWQAGHVLVDGTPIEPAEGYDGWC